LSQTGDIIAFGLPFGLGPGAAMFLAFCILGAAFIRGYSGFGFSALVVSASALVTSPLYFVPVVMLLEVAATIGQAPAAWPNANKRLLGLMLLGACIMMPLSVWGLASLDVDVLRMVISLWVLAMCALLLNGWSIRRQVGAPGYVAAGLVSGLANGAAVGGLPVALFLAAQNIPAIVFRATLIFYLCAIDLVALPMLGFNGLITRNTWIAALISLPLLGLGVWLGGRRFISASPENFRRMAISLLAFLAVLGLLKSAL
jgi:uncharacterized membrane protein YfcA